MANQKQLRILTKQGVEAWNKWRNSNRDVKVDLRYANLYSADLISANLNNANLYSADLISAKLNNVNLEDAYLTDADLNNANLTDADLSGAILRRTILNAANLSGVILRRAKLVNANLNNAKLVNANLNNAYLGRSQALGTNFDGATLTGACIEDWNINSETNFENVICDYIYLKEGKKERRPCDPHTNFEPGAFANLVQKSIETVDLIFKDGIDWKAFLTSFEKLQIECNSQELSIHSFENKNDGAFLIRVNAPTGADKAEIEKYLKKIYQLEAQVEAKSEQLADLKEITKLLANEPINNIIDITNTAESTSMSDTFNNDLKGANIANFANQVKDNATQQANQYNYASPEKQTLTEAAAEIQKLLQQLEQTNPTATPEQQEAYVNAAIPPTLKQRCVGALKAGGETAIEEFLDNPYVNVGKAVVKAWIKPE